MPNAAQTFPGTSLRGRVAKAAKLTAEQRRAGRSRASGRSNDKKANGVARASKKARPTGRESNNSSGSDSGSAALAFVGRHRISLAILVAVVFLVAMLYPVGQTYYQSMRQEQRLEAQVAAVNERNASLQEENKDLKTDEGIEDAAREQGYVREGDNAAVVTNSGQSAAQSSDIPDKVDVDSIEAPHTWYYDILDALFFVQYE